MTTRVVTFGESLLRLGAPGSNVFSKVRTSRQPLEEPKQTSRSRSARLAWTRLMSLCCPIIIPSLMRQLRSFAALASIHHEYFGRRVAWASITWSRAQISVLHELFTIANRALWHWQSQATSIGRRYLMAPHGFTSRASHRQSVRPQRIWLWSPCKQPGQ